MKALQLEVLLIAGLIGFSVSAAAEPAAALPLPADPAQQLKLPAGFKATIFARLNQTGGPRMMTFGPDGNLYVSVSQADKILMLPDRNRDGKADDIVVAADHLNAPHGLAFVDGQLLVANQDGVVRLRQDGGRWPATGTTPLISGLATGGHTLKTLKLGPDGYLYLNVGSSCNVCTESNPARATIHRYSKDGKPAGAETAGKHEPAAVWASGLRNSQGMAWQPQTRAMYATNDGADMRSDTKGGAVNDVLPPEHLNHIEPGKNYGWPHCWGDQHTDPNFQPADDGFCATTQPPAITFTSHSTPIGLAFLNNAAFPAQYKTDAIVALHGSWNREQPSGYKLVRVKFKQNKPVEVIDFATGWLNAKGAWGRPVDVIVAPDGALLVSDDRAGIIYRISYARN